MKRNNCLLVIKNKKIEEGNCLINKIGRIHVSEIEEGEKEKNKDNDVELGAIKREVLLEEAVLHLLLVLIRVLTLPLDEWLNSSLLILSLFRIIFVNKYEIILFSD